MTNDLKPRENNEHPFAPFVRILGKGKKGSRSFTAEEAEQAMGMILDDEVLDLQLGAFLMLLRVKEETPEELQGFVNAARKRFQLGTLRTPVDIDWSSYAGKRRHPPYFLLALKILAQKGYRILMHGAEGHTAGRLYTRQCVQQLGIACADQAEQVTALLDQHRLVYLPLVVLSPKLESIIQMRSVLGLRSPVHSFARLLNPLRARLVMQGIFHPPYAGLHQQAAHLLGYERTLVVKGEGGEIERNPEARSQLFLSAADGLSEEIWEPFAAERHPRASELDIERLKALWDNTASDAYGEEAVIGTLAWVIRGLNLATAQGECLTLARQWWSQRLNDDQA